MIYGIQHIYFLWRLQWQTVGLITIYSIVLRMINFISCKGLKTMCFVISRFLKVVTSYSDHSTDDNLDSDPTGKRTTNRFAKARQLYVTLLKQLEITLPEKAQPRLFQSGDYLLVKLGSRTYGRKQFQINLWIQISQI